MDEEFIDWLVDYIESVSLTEDKCCVGILNQILKELEDRELI
jgi:hypothetical protein